MSPDTYRVLEQFSELELNTLLGKAIEKAGYSSPRPIQAQSISPALDGKDILGLAQTGTGKTAAFAIPAIESLLRRKAKGPRILVIAPTRELVSQIEDEFRKLTIGTKIKSMTIYGGVSENPQIEKLKRNPDIICACPGRLLDLMRQGHVNLSRVEKLVLDEADHMFDMGFLPDINRILDELPEHRQNLLFAATMPPEIRRLAQKILVDPFVAEINHSTPAKTIDHALYTVPEKKKIDLLRHMLKEEKIASAIVFTRTKRRARQIAEKLDKDGHRAVALQGNMSQNQRDRAMQGFRKGKFDVLVATDIAARGIDVESVSHVINLDIPNTAEAYTHRIGRTGRSEREGKACTFVSAEDLLMILSIEKIIGKEIETISTPGFEGGEFDRSTKGSTGKSSRPSRRGPGPSGRRGRSSRSGSSARPSSSRGNRRPKRSADGDGTGQPVKSHAQKKRRPKASPGKSTSTSAGSRPASPRKPNNRRRNTG